MTTPVTSAATTSRSGQLPGAMSQGTPGVFLPHSPAAPPVADTVTPSRVQSMVSPVGGGDLEAARERVAFVKARCEELQATYDETRKDRALYDLRRGRNALLVAESKLSTLVQEARLARGGK